MSKPAPFKKCIIQSLADNESDADAIYRLVSKHYPVHFVPESRFVANLVSDKDIAPFNAQATLFFKESLPRLLLPVSVHGRVIDIRRGYMAQASGVRLSCPLVFTAPWVTQILNKHDMISDFDPELPLYAHAGELENFLSTGTFASEQEFIRALYEHGILKEVDIHLRDAWNIDLFRITAKEFTHGIDTVPAASIGLRLKPMFRHLMIAMGRGIRLRNWITRILTSDNPALLHADLVAGVFDESVESVGCQPAHSKRLVCVSVAGTTWTTGRNQLIKSAFEL